jgi:hypothetical protein
MKSKMKILIRVAMLFAFLQIKSVVYSQTSSQEAGTYVITFNPVYASGLIDLGYVSFEDLFLIVSDVPIKIDSVMAELSQKNYFSEQGILDTLKDKFKVYKLIENVVNSDMGIRINDTLNDYCNYGR